MARVLRLDSKIHRMKRGSLKWLLFFLLWTAIGLAFASQLYLSRAKIGEPVSWGFALRRSLADWYVFALLALPAMWTAKRFNLSFGRSIVSLAMAL